MTTTQTMQSAGETHRAGPQSPTQSLVPAMCMPALSSDPEQGLSPRGAGEPFSADSESNGNGSQGGMKHRSSLLSNSSSKDLSNGPGPKLDYRKVSWRCKACTAKTAKACFCLSAPPQPQTRKCLKRSPAGCVCQ